MRARFGRWVVLAASLLVGQVASAEPATGAARAGDAQASAEAQEDAPPAPTPLMLRAAAGRDVLAELGWRSDIIHGWLRDARRSGLRARAACLDALLSETHALERTADDVRKNAEKAAAAGDATTVERELVRLVVFDQRSRGLVGSAQQCGRSPIRSARPLAARTPKPPRR